jgi:hypothetical protein
LSAIYRQLLVILTEVGLAGRDEAILISTLEGMVMSPLRH